MNKGIYHKTLFHYAPVTGTGISIRIRYNKSNGFIGIHTCTGGTYNLGAPMNKSCSHYLGTHIGEQVLSKVFKNVVRMPPNNPGYDFICNKGYKIDAKASAIRIRDNCVDRWTFKIKRNQIPDYFLCLAFDNRIDLNPLYLWLIPGNVVNNKVSFTISLKNIEEFSEYSLDKVSDIIKCCKQ